MLCVGLMLVFAQAAVANTINHVQHMFGADHHHMTFSEIVPEFDHHQHGSAPADTGDTMPDGHPAGHHHHHGDVGSSMLVLGSTVSALPASLHDTREPRSDRLIASVRHTLPERPPRAIFSRA